MAKRRRKAAAAAEAESSGSESERSEGAGAGGEPALAEAASNYEELPQETGDLPDGEVVSDPQVEEAEVTRAEVEHRRRVAELQAKENNPRYKAVRRAGQRVEYVEVTPPPPPPPPEDVPAKVRVGSEEEPAR